MYDMQKQIGKYSQDVSKVKRYNSNTDSIDTKVRRLNTQPTKNVVDKFKESFLRFYLMLPPYSNNSLAYPIIKP